MEETINSIIYQVAMEFQETEEDFIFQTIEPYCENILERKVSKKELTELLLLGKFFKNGSFKKNLIKRIRQTYYPNWVDSEEINGIIKIIEDFFNDKEI